MAAVGKHQQTDGEKRQTVASRIVNGSMVWVWTASRIYRNSVMRAAMHVSLTHWRNVIHINKVAWGLTCSGTILKCPG